MGGCATKPKVAKDQNLPAPAPDKEDELATTTDAAATAVEEKEVVVVGGEEGEKKKGDGDTAVSLSQQLLKESSEEGTETVVEDCNKSSEVEVTTTARKGEVPAPAEILKEAVVVS